MDKVIYIVKFVSIFQVTLIVIFIALLYLTKIFVVSIEKRKKETRDEIVNKLNWHFNNSVSVASSPKTMKLLKKSIEDVLFFLSELEKNKKESEHLRHFLEELSELVLKPSARTLSRSRKWLNRYVATLCFSYGFDEKDKLMILQLINDDIVLVSVNAAKIAVKFRNSFLINAMISYFSQGRRLQQSAYVELISKDNHNISSIIEDRLQEEKDLYVKIYCYRLLNKLPLSNNIIDKVKEDLEINSIDLKIAILNYISKIDDELKNDLLYTHAQAPHWEVKAVVAKLLDKVDSKKSLGLLDNMLKDSEWWVRINAAHTLGKKGKEGIEILKNQSPELDKFAYETATEVLRQIEVYGVKVQ